MSGRLPMVRIIANALIEAKTAEEKVKVLKKYDQDLLFKRIVSYAHNPLIHLGMEDFEPRTTVIGKEHGMGISKFMHLPEDIHQSNLTRKEADFAINMVLSHINDEEVDLFLGILKKDLGLGLTLDIINEGWDNYIPPYPVMQHSEYNEEEISKWQNIIIQKFDFENHDKRVNIIVRNEKVEFRDTDGSVIEDFNEYGDQFKKLAQEGRIVFDSFWNGKKFVLFDSIRYDGFVEGSDNRLGYNWRYNGIEQMWFLSKIDNPPWVCPEYMTVASIADMKKEVTKLGKSCYLRSPSGTWHDGVTTDWQLVTPDDVS